MSIYFSDQENVRFQKAWEDYLGDEKRRVGWLKSDAERLQDLCELADSRSQKLSFKLNSASITDTCKNLPLKDNEISEFMSLWSSLLEPLSKETGQKLFSAQLKFFDEMYEGLGRKVLEGLKVFIPNYLFSNEATRSKVRSDFKDFFDEKFHVIDKLLKLDVTSSSLFPVKLPGSSTMRVCLLESEKLALDNLKKRLSISQKEINLRIAAAKKTYGKGEVTSGAVPINPIIAALWLGIMNEVEESDKDVCLENLRALFAKLGIEVGLRRRELKSYARRVPSEFQHYIRIVSKDECSKKLEDTTS